MTGTRVHQFDYAGRAIGTRLQHELISAVRCQQPSGKQCIGSFGMTCTNETSSTRPASGSRVRFAATLMIGTAALSGCFNLGFNCLTLDEYDRIAASEPELVGVIERKSVGEIVTNSGSPWMRDAVFTGEACTVEVKKRGGSAFALVSFLDGPVELKVPMSEIDFYVGLVDRNTAVVVQQVPGGTIATETPFANDGTLEYGDCMRLRSWYRECHVSPEPIG